MKTLHFQNYACSNKAALSLLTCATIFCAHAFGSTTVTVKPGDNIQAAVTAAPAGTTFLLEAGMYRLQSVIPKTGDHFTSNGIVILNGSEELTFIQDPAGSGLWVANAVYDGIVNGSCDSAHPLCAYDQDLFVDSTLQMPATSPTNLAAGSWYFDHVNGKVYIPTNPSGHELELGSTPLAFSGSATNVLIDHITVEKYAVRAQWGAIGGNTSGSAWEVTSVESCLNHGAGIYLGPNSQILNSYIHHNGQIGIKLSGANVKAVNNEVSWNNQSGFYQEWEAGGSKFWSTTNLVVQGNYVHDNIGKGLWTDTNNVGTVYDANVVMNNAGVGIQHEVSYSSIIRNNIVKGNSAVAVAWLGNAQIRLMNSSNGNVYSNTIEVPPGLSSGIALVNETPAWDRLGCGSRIIIMSIITSSLILALLVSQVFRMMPVGL